MTSETFNGWANYDTWNVALYIQNEEPVYRHCRIFGYLRYEYLVPWLQGYFGLETPDEVRLDSNTLDVAELDEMLLEL